VATSTLGHPGDRPVRYLGFPCDARWSAGISWQRGDDSIANDIDSCCLGVMTTSGRFSRSGAGRIRTRDTRVKSPLL
jgi:hypothetical protein